MTDTKSTLHIVVETKELMHALSFANSVVEKKNVIAELGNIKLSAKSTSLEIIATDMDLYLSQNIGAQVLLEGAITVSTQTFTDVIRKISDKEVTIKVSHTTQQLEIIGKDCYFALLTLPVDKFPSMASITAESILTIPCKDFSRIIDYTQFSVSNEEMRYNLSGIYLHTKDGALCSATTDGHRFSFASASLDDASKVSEFGIILPRKTASEILKIAKDVKNTNSNLQIFLSTNKVKFVCNNVVMISKLIDATFPSYENFFPQNNPYKLTISRAILAEAIDRIAAITVDKFRAIKMTFTDEGLAIVASGEARGTGKEKIPYCASESAVCQYEGPEMFIGFNPRYLSELLNVIKEDTVEIYLQDSSSPSLIKIQNNVHDAFVIMPVKV